MTEPPLDIRRNRATGFAFSASAELVARGGVMPRSTFSNPQPIIPIDGCESEFIPGREKILRWRTPRRTKVSQIMRFPIASGSGWRRGIHIYGKGWNKPGVVNVLALSRLPSGGATRRGKARIRSLPVPGTGRMIGAAWACIGTAAPSLEQRAGEIWRRKWIKWAQRLPKR